MNFSRFHCPYSYFLSSFLIYCLNAINHFLVQDNLILKQVSKPGKAFKIAHIALNIPFIKKRDTFIQGHAVNRLQENGTILILSGSIDEVKL